MGGAALNRGSCARSTGVIVVSGKALESSLSVGGAGRAVAGAGSMSIAQR